MRLLILQVLGIAAIAGAAFAGDWPQFLGPQRNGVAEGSLPDHFPAGGPKVLWERDLGSGFAGPVVVDGKLLIYHRQGDEGVLEACDAASGVMLWRFAHATDYVDSFGFDNGPRGVPAVADGRVFLHGPEGLVHAVDLATGTKLWSVDTAAEFGSGQGFFGRAGSPLVVGGNVIVTPGGTKDGKAAGIVALDVKDGHVVWQAADDEAGYASPVLVPARDGQPESLLCWMRNKLWLLDAATGKELASHPLRSSMDASVNAAQPVDCGEGRYLVSAGYGVGANLVQLPKLEVLWQHQDLLDCHYGTPVRVAGHLYGFDGRQESGQRLVCIDVKAETRRWEGDRVPGGTVVAVGDKLLVVTEQGELWLVRASPEKFERLDSAQILRAGHRSHPAFANGVLYARDGRQLVAVRVAE